jgi:hypothetical protein
MTATSYLQLSPFASPRTGGYGVHRTDSAVTFCNTKVGVATWCNPALRRGATGAACGFLVPGDHLSAGESGVGERRVGPPGVEVRAAAPFVMPRVYRYLDHRSSL